MNEKQTRAKYTPEFKQEAVRQVKAGRAASLVAATLGMPKASLTNWVRADAKGQLAVTSEGKATTPTITCGATSATGAACTFGDGNDRATNCGCTWPAACEAMAGRFGLYPRPRCHWRTMLVFSPNDSATADTDAPGSPHAVITCALNCSLCRRRGF
ncbi:TPA: transposase [Pseudomonas aeruginosa]|nr:transposase [Pseudomonas aeruginosa]MBI7325671.1 transposase [Pseudomonas aeruginosa]MBI7495044.1 transposase [Pseudomonas aeruginosa]HCF7139901.1 transposase [Pseudomonas aeruginosa]HCF7613344.1 transposase [Pseudomonas aeruginosa]